LSSFLRPIERGTTNIAATTDVHNWRELLHEWPRGDRSHAEWWVTGRLAGLSEGKVRVRCFVDLPLNHVRKWGEERAGAFRAKDQAEELSQRSCTSGDVVRLKELVEQKGAGIMSRNISRRQFVKNGARCTAAALAAAGVGNGDTQTIRAAAEILP
jgi:hypothetical protein